MNLRYISNKYQENLISFFNSPQVIDEIYKEQVHKSKYQSGLFENNIAHNKNISRLTVNDNFLSNFIQKIKWFNFTKSINLPRKEDYYISSGHESVEEVTHHWQARNVVLTSEEDIYTSIGNKAVERMINTSSKRTKILEKKIYCFN